MMSPDWAMTPREFLTMLWGDPPPAPVYIYMLPTRQSIWFSHFENLDAAVALHADKDVYTSGGLGPLDNPHRASNRRVQQKDVAGIAGLWADIDVAHQVHGKKDLPQTVEQALEILELAEPQPTMLVDSGHGIQAWWLFTSPWLFQNTQEYWEARRLSSWWHDRIQALYQNEGCRIDSVQNLDRVMRIPGTWNNKIKTDVRPVRLMKNTGERFNLEEFLEMMPPDYRPRVMVHGTTPDGEVIGGDNLRLDPTAEVPTMKFGELIAEDTRFFRSWKEDRPDWPDDADRSPSGYDMSLASIAARNGWTDQEICDLLIAKRRERGQPLKLREDYYARTIAKAHEPPFTGVGNDAPGSQEPPFTGAGNDAPGSQEPPSQEPPEDGQDGPADESPSNTAGELAAATLLKEFRAYVAAPTIEHLETLADAATRGMHPDVQVPFLVDQAAGALREKRKSSDSLAALLTTLRQAEESVRHKAHATTLADAAALPLPRSLLRAKGLTGSVLDSGEVAVLSGMGGAGKSTLTLGLAMHIAALGADKRGAISGIFEAEGGTVLMVGYEDRTAVVGRRGLRLARHLDEGDHGQFHDSLKSVHVLEMRNPMFGPDSHSPLYNARPSPLEGWEEVRNLARTIKLALIIIDPALCAYVGESNNPAAVSEFLLMLRDLARECGCGVILVTHSTKAARGNGRRAANPTDPGQVAGSGSWTDRARCAMTLTTGPEGVPMLAVSKANYGPQKIWIPLTTILDEGVPIGFDASAAAWTDIPEPEENGGAKPKQKPETEKGRKGRFDD